MANLSDNTKLIDYLKSKGALGKAALTALATNLYKSARTPEDQPQSNLENVYFGRRKSPGATGPVQQLPNGIGGIQSLEELNPPKLGPQISPIGDMTEVDALTGRDSLLNMQRAPLDSTKLPMSDLSGKVQDIPDLSGLKEEEDATSENATPGAPSGVPTADSKPVVTPPTPKDNSAWQEGLAGALAGIGDSMQVGAGRTSPGTTAKVIENLQAKVSNDPNSESSMMIANVAEEVLQRPKGSLSGKISEAQLIKVAPWMEKIIATREAAAQRAEAAKDRAALLQSNKDFTIGTRANQHQDKLEKEYRDMLNKSVTSVRSPLGIEERKLDAAVHVMTMLEAAYNPETKQYEIPPSMHQELAMGMASLLGGGTAPSESMIEELRQATAREGLAGALIWAGFDPKKIGGTTQSVTNFFEHAIHRQALTSQKNRDVYVRQFREKAPTGLSDERRDYIDKSEVGTDFGVFYIKLLKKKGLFNEADQEAYDWAMKNKNPLASGNTDKTSAKQNSIKALKILEGFGVQ